MQRDVHPGVDRVEVIQHEHLQVIVLHRDAAVLGHDEVDAHNLRTLRITGVELGLHDLKAEQGLREDLLGWEAAEDLVKPAYLLR